MQPVRLTVIPSGLNRTEELFSIPEGICVTPGTSIENSHFPTLI
jgi:hypothetical protein